MIAKFLPYLRAPRWQVAWALAQVFLVAGGRAPQTLALADRAPPRPGSRSPRETAGVADIQQAMLLNYRPATWSPLEYANPAQAVLQFCQYSFNIPERYYA
jgi:hypothetical protein